MKMASLISLSAVGAGFLVATVSAFGLCAGFEDLNLRADDPADRVECEYHAAVDFNPGRIAICELYRRRW